jgi:DNA mismatch repair ATPase MutS
VKKSNTLNDQRKVFENLLIINENEWNILNGALNQFDNGGQYSSNESYSADLDVFGNASIFHLINRTSTSNGSDGLAHLLKHPFTNSATITRYQEAIKTFSSQPEIQEQIIANGFINKDNVGALEGIKKWLAEPTVLVTNKWIGVARYIVPALNIAALLIYLSTDNYSWLSLTVLCSWIHVGVFTKYISQQHLLLGKKQETLEQYSSILYQFAAVQTGESAFLKQQKHVASEAHGQVKKLSKLTNLLDQRLNLLVNFLFNSFFLYDIQSMLLLEDWKLKNKQHLQRWIESVSTIEVLTSLSRFAFNHPGFCYPTLVEELGIQAEEMSHPLIPMQESILNNISVGKTGKLLLITGSNMSGKTTFLRTIGSNVLLAQCGAPVCAKSFIFSPVRIYTSIRISDSLQEHTSYFMAELNRLSQIKESISAMQPSLVLIDEILRGTNSEDKYYGSAAFIKKLVRYNCLSLFATHDLKLSELENEYKGLIENYCFESIIEGDDLTFDYKILRGVAQNKNASFLMKKMKII